MAESGWYPDPTGQHELRWFDGSMWTDHVHTAGIVACEPGPFAAAGPLGAAGPPALDAAAPGQMHPSTATSSPQAPPGPGSWPAPEAQPGSAEPASSPDPAAPQGVGGAAADNYPPVPASGLGLLVAFGVLVLGGVLLPFASVGGGSAEAIASDIEAALPTIVLAVAVFAAAWAGKAGFDVAPAFGGGAIVVFSVLVALVAPFIKALFDVADAFGGSVSPNIGIISFVAAAVVGVIAAAPIVASVARSAGAGQMPNFVGMAAAGGTGLYLWGVTRPAYEGAPVLTGDWYVDAVILVLAAAIVIPAVLVVVVRSASSAALLAGALLFPAMSWFQSAQSGVSSLAVSRPAGFDEMGMGLLAALSACAFGVFGYARRAVAGTEGTRFIPAKSVGAATMVIGVVVVAGLIGLSQSDDSLSRFDGYGTSDTGYSGDGAPPECTQAWMNGYTAPIYCEDYGYGD